MRHSEPHARPGWLLCPILRIQPGDGLLGVVECPDMVRVGEGEAGEGDVMEHLGRIEGGDGYQILLGKPPINILKMGQGGEHHPLMLTMVHQGAETLTIETVYHALNLRNPRQHTLFIERADKLTGDQVFLHIEDELTVLFIKGHTTFLSMTRAADNAYSFRMHQCPNEGLLVAAVLLR